MAARNGQSVFDILTDGWRRKVIQLNSEGTLVISIPLEFRDDLGVEKGDEVAIKPSDDQDGVLEVYFE